jgi:hypothetical protein
MDEIMKSEHTAKVLYLIKEIMIDHHISLKEAFFLLCQINNASCQFDKTAKEEVEYLTTDEKLNLFTKGLVSGNMNVNTTKLFHLNRQTENPQLELELELETEPNGSEISLKIAHRIEKEFVADEDLSEDECKYIASKYFKGDINVARYFIIFRALFPTRDPKRNYKWNSKFGFIYTGVGLRDTDLKVTKKFHEIYRKKDIGVFLEATYNKVRDSIDLEKEKCYMMKPYKFLNSYDDYYRTAQKKMKEREENAASGNAGTPSKNDGLNESLNNLKL